MSWKQAWWIFPISLIVIAYYLFDGNSKKDVGSRREFNDVAQNTTSTITNCENSKPWKVKPGKYFVCRDTYALSMNPESKMADWVSYCVDETSIKENGEKQSRNWEPDPDLPDYAQLEPEDYQGVGSLGYDRGHQAPLATFKGENWQETNYTSNITPQKLELNRGPWMQLEKYERSLVKKYGSICTITGPYYQISSKVERLSNANEPHVIPSGYWKVIRYSNKVEGYLYSQETSREEDFKLGSISVDEIENFVGFEID